MTPVRLALPGRTLLLVAGMPGAGKSTLLARLPARPDVVVLDSDAQRAALRPVFGAVPYRRYRPLVHAWHRLAVLVAAFSAVPTVVVHLPATSARTRSVVALLARWTGRAAHLLWLQVDPADARAGQRDRGRVVEEASFAGHASRALATTDALRDGPPPGYAEVTVLDRRAAAGGLCLAADVAGGGDCVSGRSSACRAAVLVRNVASDEPRPLGRGQRAVRLITGHAEPRPGVDCPQERAVVVRQDQRAGFGTDHGSAELVT